MVADKINFMIWISVFRFISFAVFVMLNNVAKISIFRCIILRKIDFYLIQISI